MFVCRRRAVWDGQYYSVTMPKRGTMEGMLTREQLESGGDESELSGSVAPAIAPSGEGRRLRHIRRPARGMVSA